jgi:non-ribosomal peptide synthetase component F
MMGMFVNTLAMRGRPERDKTYRELLEEIKETSLKNFEQQIYPFEELVAQLDVQRDMSRNPLFDVMLTLQNNEEEVLNIEGMEIVNNEIGIASKCDISIDIVATAKGYELNWEYAQELFTSASMNRFSEHYEWLFHQLLTDPDQILHHITLVTVEEERKLLHEWRASTTKTSQYTLIDEFEGWVQRTPHKIAVAYEDESLTYDELNRRANQLARILISSGIQANDVIGILLPRTPEMIVSILGIWKAGGAYLPMDIDHPLQRKLEVSAESAANIILTRSLYVEVRLQEEYHGEIFCIDQLESQLEQQIDTNIEHNIDGKQLAYILFTSGTTGKPKGVMIEHRGMLNHIWGERESLQLDENLRFAQTANQCFDISVWQLVGALALGGTTVIYSNEHQLQLDQMVKSIEEDQI